MSEELSPDLRESLQRGMAQSAAEEAAPMILDTSPVADFLMARVDRDALVYSGHQHGLRPELARHLFSKAVAERTVVRFLSDLERGEYGDAMSSSIAYSVLCRMADAYSEHPDFDQEWRA